MLYANSLVQGKDSMTIPEFSLAFDNYTDKLANEADADGDGKLDIHEIEAMEAHIKALYVEQEAQIKALDADGDGQISKAEWVAIHGNTDGYQGEDSESELEIVLDDVSEAQNKADAAGSPGGLNGFQTPLGSPKIDDQRLEHSQSVAVGTGTTEALFIDQIQQNPTARGNGNSSVDSVVYDTDGSEDQALQNVVDDVTDAQIEANAARSDQPKTRGHISIDEQIAIDEMAFQLDGDSQL